MLKKEKQPLLSGGLIAVLTVLLFNGTGGIAEALAGFSDVTASNSNFDAITFAQKNNIVSGYGDGTYKPLNHINRAEFTKIVVGAALGYNPAQDPSGFDIYSLNGIKFPDTAKGQWYIPYLRKALEKGIISGYPDGTFKPANDISFSEASKMIVKAFNFQTPTDPIWYKPYVGKLGEMKAIPTSIVSFAYKINRGEMAEIIYRIKANIADKPSSDYVALSGGGTTSGGTGGNTGGSGGSSGGSTSGGTGGTGGIGTGNSPMISANCPVFPLDNPWNKDISKDPLDPNSGNYINNILNNGGDNLHADFGGGGEYGIPYEVVGANQPKVAINFTESPEESDPGPYPIPAASEKELGEDGHVIALDKDNCKLYELYTASKTSQGWDAGSGAIFDLTSNALRPDGWTSADAAGLPIFPGLVRYDEVAAGEINHALRFTVNKTQKGYIHPATHFAASSTDPNLPPMGLRLRLKADFDLSGYSGETLVILKALKKYGMILADNGSNWFISGQKDPRWDDDDLNQLKGVPGSAFEVVKSGEILRTSM